MIQTPVGKITSIPPKHFSESEKNEWHEDTEIA